MSKQDIKPIKLHMKGEHIVVKSQRLPQAPDGKTEFVFKNPKRPVNLSSLGPYVKNRKNSQILL